MTASTCATSFQREREKRAGLYKTVRNSGVIFKTSLNNNKEKRNYENYKKASFIHTHTPGLILFIAIFVFLRDFVTAKIVGNDVAFFFF